MPHEKLHAPSCAQAIHLPYSHILCIQNILASAVHHQLAAVEALVSQRQPPQGIPLVRVDAGVVDHEVQPVVRQQPGQDLPKLPAQVTTSPMRDEPANTCLLAEALGGESVKVLLRSSSCESQEVLAVLHAIWKWHVQRAVLLSARDCILNANA